MWSALGMLLGPVISPTERNAVLVAWSPLPSGSAILWSVHAVAPYIVALWALGYLFPRKADFPRPRHGAPLWPPVLAGSILLGFYVLAPPREVSQADERARIQAMPVEPGMASVRFRLFFNGKPLRHVPDGPVHVSLFDLKAQRPTTQLARMVNGVVEVPTVPTGVYRADILLFQDGKPVSRRARTLTVEKVGVERALYVWAHVRPWSYGLAAMAFALLAGWGASAAFRRD